jgi:hypothetical protein
MVIGVHREVVLEIEHIRVLRRRTTTRLRSCPICKRPADFAGLVRIAGLFSTTPSELLSFVNANSCHFLVDPDGEIHICLARLLAAINGRKNAARVKLLGA